MKKIINGIKAFFMGIWHIIDKFIVVPITKLVFIINNKLTQHIKYKLYSTRPLYPPPITFFNILLSVRYNLKQTPNRKYIRWEYKRKDCGIYTFSNIKE